MRAGPEYQSDSRAKFVNTQKQASMRMFHEHAIILPRSNKGPEKVSIHGLIK